MKGFTSNYQMKIDNLQVFSVIMPFFNAESTIEDSIRSVFEQDFQNWELILFNDRSTDQSFKKIQPFLLDKRVLYLENNSDTHHGPSYARNQSIKLAQGDYIAFLDSDDLWEPKYLSNRMDVFRKYRETAMVYGPALYFYDTHYYQQDCGIEKSKLFGPGELVLNFITNNKGTPCPSGAVVKADVFRSIGGFRENLMRGEDAAFFMEICNFYPVFYDERILFKYRRHLDSSTSRSNQKNTRLQLELPFYQWQIQFVRGLRNQPALLLAQLSFLDHALAFYSDEKGGLDWRRFKDHVNSSNLDFMVKYLSVLHLFLPKKWAKRIRYRMLKIFYS